MRFLKLEKGKGKRAQDGEGKITNVVYYS